MSSDAILETEFEVGYLWLIFRSNTAAPDRRIGVIRDDRRRFLCEAVVSIRPAFYNFHTFCYFLGIVSLGVRGICKSDSCVRGSEINPDDEVGFGFKRYRRDLKGYERYFVIPVVCHVDERKQGDG